MKTGFFRVEFVLLPRFKYDSVNIILNGTKAQSNGNCKESIRLKIYRLESKLKALKIKKNPQDHVITDNTASGFPMASSVWS